MWLGPTFLRLFLFFFLFLLYYYFLVYSSLYFFSGIGLGTIFVSFIILILIYEGRLSMLC